VLFRLPVVCERSVIVGASFRTVKPPASGVASTPPSGFVTVTVFAPTTAAAPMFTTTESEVSATPLPGHVTVEVIAASPNDTAGGVPAIEQSKSVPVKVTVGDCC
jgi:hypothetical protein